MAAGRALVSPARADDRTAALLRRGLLALVALSIAGTALELATVHHWQSPVQLVAWIALAALAVATGLLARQPTRVAVQAARALAVAVLLSAAAGVLTHVHENYEAGPLDQRFEATWGTMSEGARWWAAVSKTVGPAPPLAPAVLGQAALGLLFATLRHPALQREGAAQRDL